MLIEAGYKGCRTGCRPYKPSHKGSILGDKTRMETLTKHPEAYIRPSPAGGTLGGVARKSRETMLLCEAAGYDIILVETVGGWAKRSYCAIHGRFLYAHRLNWCRR